MTLPASWATVPVTLDTRDIDGNDHSGFAILTPKFTGVCEGVLVTPQSRMVSITDGVMEDTSLPATDDLDVTYSGTPVWSVYLSIPGAPAAFDLTVPAASGTINLATEAPVVDSDLDVVSVGDAFLAARVADEDSDTRAAIDAAVAAALADLTPGIELDYDERTSNYAAAAGGTLTGLSVTVVGEGRPVDIEFRCKGVYHTTIGAQVQATIVDASANIVGSAKVATYSTTDGPPLDIRTRRILTDGVSYTFTVTVSQNTAGTHTLIGSLAQPIFLSVVSR